MAQIFYVRGAVTDGSYFTGPMPLDYASAQVQIDFYDINGDIVTPTAGTVVVTASMDGVTYRSMPNGSFAAIDTYRETNIQPAFNGAARMFKITLANVAGAVTFQAAVMRSGSDIASNIQLTDSDANIGRLPVDVGSTGFFAGREVRFFYEFSIPTGESRWLRIVAPDVILAHQIISVDAGAIRYRAWRDATDSGPWAAPASPTSGLFSSNPIAAAEYGHTTETTVEIGGNLAVATDGTVSEIARVRTSGATAQQVTVGLSSPSERGIAAGTYHLQLENISNATATGVYNFVLEERSGLI